MNPLQRCKFINVTSPAAIVDNAAFTTNEVDTLGFNYATFVIVFGAMDIAMAALKVQHSDTSGSGFADISGADFSSGTDIEGTAAALPSATADDKVYVFQINLLGKKRYLDVSATGGDGTAGTYMSAICILSDAESFAATNAAVCSGKVIRV